LIVDNFIAGFTLGILAEMSPNTVMEALNVLGDIIAENSNICQLLVQAEGDDSLINCINKLY
jgi:hypothetical protein